MVQHRHEDIMRLAEHEERVAASHLPAQNSHQNIQKFHQRLRVAGSC